MPLNQQVLAGMSPYQQRVLQKTLGISAAQRQAKGVSGVWDKYYAAMNAAGIPRPQPQAGPDPKPGGGGPAAGGGRPGVGAGAMGGAGYNPGKNNPLQEGGITNLAQQLGLIGPGGSTLSSLDIIPTTYGGKASDPSVFNKLLGYYGLDTSSIDSILAPYNVAGLEQYRQNQSGDASRLGVAGNPALHNVGMDVDLNALLRIVGEASGAASRGTGAADALKATWATRQGMVPEWYGSAQEAAKGAGATYGQTGAARTNLELLGDPGINYTDPNQPLFAKGYSPHSLSQLTGNQAGEEDFYRTLSAQELLSQIGPMYNAYFNREAGSAPTTGGMQFGDIGGGYDQNISGNFIDNLGNLVGSGNPITQSPVRGSDAYQRWTAFNQLKPISDFSPFLQGESYNPLTGEGSLGTAKNAWANALITGGVRPEYIGDNLGSSTWTESNIQNLIAPFLGTAGTALYLNDPSRWFAGPYAPYNPSNLDPATLARLIALATSQQATGA